MITKNTVFILGAGASFPYKFPLGAELRDIICHSWCRDTSYSGWEKRLKENSHFSAEQIAKFRKSFMESHTISIDAFLSRHENFAEIGKAVIAAILINFESQGVLNEYGMTDDWYFYLWNAISADASKPEELQHNKLKFITFNYDRSLEHYLYQSCQNTYMLDQLTDISGAISHMDILHMYGLLGTFTPIPSSSSRCFGNHLDRHALELAAKSIKVIPETRDTDSHFSRARGWLYEADTICFLGFGFDPQNCRRLALPQILDKKQNDGLPMPRIVANVLNKTQMEIEHARLLICPRMQWQTHNLQNTATLRESGILLNWST